MEYANTAKYDVSEVDGYILQAPVSDRETAGMLMPPDFFKASLMFSVDMIACGNKDAIMPNDLVPNIFDSPITAYRWHSLISKRYVCRRQNSVSFTYLRTAATMTISLPILTMAGWLQNSAVSTNQY